MFKALLLEESDGKVTGSIQDLEETRLPEGNVTVAVEHSTLNYKDGMILNGIGRLVRSYPARARASTSPAPWIESESSGLQAPGDRVVLDGLAGRRDALGRLCPEGPGQERLAGASCPTRLSTRRAMAIGTAGFTSMLAVIALEEHGLDAGCSGSDPGDRCCGGSRLGRRRHPRQAGPSRWRLPPAAPRPTTI